MKLARKFVNRWSRVVTVLVERKQQHEDAARLALGLSQRDLRNALGIRVEKNEKASRSREAFARRAVE